MSPTEFANYIKQRAQMQQQMQLQQQQQHGPATSAAVRPFGETGFYGGPQQSHYPYRNGASSGSIDAASYPTIDSMNRFSGFGDDLSTSPFFSQSMGPLSPVATTASSGAAAATSIAAVPTTAAAAAAAAAANPANSVAKMQQQQQQDKHFLENFNFTLNSPGPSSPYQHLLLAN